jgi:hypothetical protein
MRYEVLIAGIADTPPAERLPHIAVDIDRSLQTRNPHW